MQLRQRLTLYTTILVAITLLIASICVYHFASNNRASIFQQRVNYYIDKIEEEQNSTSIDLELLRAEANTFRKVLGAVDFELYQPNGLLFSSSNATKKLVTPEQLKRVLNSKRSIELQGSGYEGVLRPIQTKTGNVAGYIAFVYGNGVGMSKLESLKLSLILVSIIMTLISGILAWIIINKNLGYLSVITHEVQTISGSSLSTRLKLPKREDEIRKLGASFNEMLDRLEFSFEMQRGFVANATHELRTPLTAINGQIEVALMKPRPEEQYRSTLRSIKEDVAWLSDLANSILDLMQTNLDIKNIHTTEIRIDEVLFQAQTDLNKTRPGYDIDIEFEDMPDDEEQLTVLGNEQLLKTSFSNVMSNACKFSIDQHCEVKLFIRPTSVKIDFKDNGIGIGPEEIKKIFEPFYRANNARHIKGHGLGVPLTNKIIIMHGGQLQIDSQKGIGTTVSVILPNVKASLNENNNLSPMAGEVNTQA